MAYSRVFGAISALALLVGIVVPAYSTEPNGAWAERVQIVYQDATRSVTRVKVRVWDQHPERGLDFTWEPARGEENSGIAADGTISGKGKLVWRVRGSASYDPKTIFSVYQGEMRDGRPNGRGRLEIRSGEVFEGDWVNGALEGSGIHVDAAGDRYEGEFVGGVAQGPGRLMAKTGEIFSGAFRNGLKHGKGKTTLAGGTTYVSEWAFGKEIAGTRPSAVVDAGVGGLLKAQSGGGDAGKVEISTSIDQRMTQQSDMQYQHLVRDEDVAIYPVAQEINDAWNGTNKIEATTYPYEFIDWEDAPAFVEIGLQTTDGSRVKVEDLELQVASSDSYRKPMLSLTGHVGCVGYRPTFSLVNNGWGKVQNARMSVQFTNAEAGENASRSFERTLGEFDNGLDVALGDVLSEAGVDTAKLENERFSCQSADSLNVCRSQVFNNVGFGEIADFISGEDKLFTTAMGTVSYDWADDFGNVYQAAEPFRVDVALVTIELPPALAECGDGFGGSPEALRYQDVKLPVGQRDYVVEMPMRGNKNVSEYVARLKMSAEMSSFHQFQTVAKFADGSERRSKTVSLFYFRPRPVTFQSSVQLPVCYLPETAGGC